MKATANFGFRYQYLAGGANTGNGWATWNPDGQFVTYYIQDSMQNGLTPVFTYYQIRQSQPGSSQPDDQADSTNLQNASTMTAYFNDLKLFFQRAGSFSNTTVVLHVEPDLWGFMEQKATNDDARTVPAQVASTGLPELSALPNNLSGVAQAIAKLRDAYAPNVRLGYHLSVWGTGNDILYTKPDNTTVSALATQAANYFLSLGGNFDVAFAEFSDRDAAFKQYQYNDGGAAWWASGDYSRNELFISQFVQVGRRRVVFWQIPYGNTRMRAMINTWDHYQDNHVEWLLDDPSRTNLNAYLHAGVIAFLFGRGSDGATCACDAANDGITNPPPINGNTGLSYNADDDGGFFRHVAAAYYATGPLALPGGGPPPATATSTPTRTSTATRTSTPTPSPSATSTYTPVASTPTPTPTPPSQLTITFDDLSPANRPLDGVYPSGEIDWGVGSWYVSGPYAQDSSNSVSFNGAGPTSASLSFVTARQVISIQAYNGGWADSLVSLSCPEQSAPVQVGVPAGQSATLQTGWSGTCTTLTIGSTNGWDTNFDNLVIQ